MNKIAVLFINLYKKILSPILPPACRFTPSCSEYALVAFQNLGFFRATYLTLWRVFRCNPFFESGYDPVPIPGINTKNDPVQK